MSEVIEEEKHFISFLSFLSLDYFRLKTVIPYNNSGKPDKNEFRKQWKQAEKIYKAFTGETLTKERDPNVIKAEKQFFDMLERGEIILGKYGIPERSNNSNTNSGNKEISI